jgi:hypothetical protein
MNTLLCNAIKNKQRIAFLYHKKPRVGEPQCHGITTTGKPAVRVRLVRGGSRSEQLFEVAKLEALTLLDEFF